MLKKLRLQPLLLQSSQGHLHQNNLQIRLSQETHQIQKILKWMSDQKTHVLTLIRFDGEVKKISREQALGLSVEDMQDLLELTLCRDEDDTASLDFEL
ncbi:hypothetical protein Hanom_Chr08g00721151 [Helianthus anomalus]